MNPQEPTTPAIISQNAESSAPDGTVVPAADPAVAAALGRIAALSREVTRGSLPREEAVRILHQMGYGAFENLIPQPEKEHLGSCWSSSQGDCPCISRRKA